MQIKHQQNDFINIQYDTSKYKLLCFCYSSSIYLLRDCHVMCYSSRQIFCYLR